MKPSYRLGDMRYGDVTTASNYICTARLPGGLARDTETVALKSRNAPSSSAVCFTY